MVLSVLSIWSTKSTTSTTTITGVKGSSEPVDVSVKPVNDDKEIAKPMDNVDASGSSAPIGAQVSPEVPTDPAPATEPTSASSPPEDDVEHLKPEPTNKPTPRPDIRPRFSFRSLGFFQGGSSSKAAPSTSATEKFTKEQDQHERQKAKTAAKRATLALSMPRTTMFSPSNRSRSTDRRVEKEALAVQRLIVGPSAITFVQNGDGSGSGSGGGKSRPAIAAPVPRAQMVRIKSELMKPKSANRLIAKLRELPAPEGSGSVEVLAGTKSKVSSTTVLSNVSGKSKAKTSSGNSKGKGNSTSTGKGASASALPIHAVCLENTESEIQSKHFSKLSLSPDQSIISASLDALSSLFSELHIVDLLSAPDLGLGQPASGEGLLAGALPSPETVLDGAAKLTQLTPQLIALGYATGQAVLPPDHSLIHPPTDRLSVLTYWWGLELCLPPPTLTHLAQAPSIAHQVINFLSALSLMYGGVREILPFVRYIGQFVDFEWGAIEKADKGKGVVCAATWIMPAAMVPRPWDFPDPPGVSTGTGTGTGTGAPESSTGGKNAPVPDAPGSSTTPNGPLPTLVVTPPSEIKNASATQAMTQTKDVSKN